MANKNQIVHINQPAGTSPAVEFYGGKYMLTWQATLAGGNLQLQTLSGDGVTYVPVGAAITALGAFNFDLAPGQYQVTITTSTANYVVITNIPYSAT